MNKDQDDIYFEQLKSYYNLKQKYTKQKDSAINKIINDKSIDIDMKKKLLAKEKFKCVNCGKYGGTIFNETSLLLRATCGNAEAPCKLDMKIKKKNYELLLKSIDDITQEINLTKKNIISTKLDFLFKYIEEDSAVEQFETMKTEMNRLQENYNTMIINYKNITDNKEMNNLIDEKNVENEKFKNEYSNYIDLFKTTNEIRYLKDAVSIYVSKIKNLDKEIIELKYKYNSIETDDNGKYLIQDKYNLYDLEIEKQ